MKLVMLGTIFSQTDSLQCIWGFTELIGCKQLRHLSWRGYGIPIFVAFSGRSIRSVLQVHGSTCDFHRQYGANFSLILPGLSRTIRKPPNWSFLAIQMPTWHQTSHANSHTQECQVWPVQLSGLLYIRLFPFVNSEILKKLFNPSTSLS